MARDIPVGNGELLITFDSLYRVRDIYFPNVGRFNHSDGEVQRFGVWADGELIWIEDPSWRRSIRYRPDTLVTDVVLTNDRLGLELRCNDAVDVTEAVFFRRTLVRDLLGRERDVRIFQHWDLSIGGTPVGDTAAYDPANAAVVVYKDDVYFMFSACDELRCGIDSWAIGTKRLGNAEGTWRDAEDGKLGRNAISQGSVDATLGFNLQVSPKGEAYVTSWLVAGKSYEEVQRINRMIMEQGPDRMIARTGAYWRLWSLKEQVDLTPLPASVGDLFTRSQLIVRTQIDNGGAIIAANDSDNTQWGGDHYSYCWMRDGALVARALQLAGQSDLSRRFFQFCCRAIKDNSYFLHKYNPLGQYASSWHPWIIEGQRVVPIQQDETSLVIWSLRHHFETFRDVEFVKDLYVPLVAKPADWILSYRDANGLPIPSWDLWEERRGIHTFTVAATIAALEAAAKFADDFGDHDRAVAYRDGSSKMRKAMLRYLWHEESQRFARMATPTPEGGYRLDMTPDSANFALFNFGVLDVDDPRMVMEMESLRARLEVKTDIGGFARYSRDYFHQVERDRVEEVPGNPWVICTLWQAQYLIARAKTEDQLKLALPLLEWCVKRAQPSGALAEQFHPYTGEPLSVCPLTWSHSTFVTVVIEYLERLRAIENGESAR